MVTGSPAMQTSPHRHFWFDVEDLFEYSRVNMRPSGIQRVAFAIQNALRGLPDMQDRVGFLRHSPDGRHFHPVAWSEVAALYERLASHATPHSGRLETAAPPVTPSTLRRLALRLPPAVRVPLGQLIAHQSGTRKALPQLLRGAGHTLKEAFHHTRAKTDATFSPAPQDVLLALGAPWSHADYGALIGHYRQTHDMQFCLLVHDIIPLLFPEWCPAGLPRIFERWLRSILPHCDRVFGVSRATCADLKRVFPNIVAQPISMGTVLAAKPHAAATSLSLPDRYVLSVGTFEARKNHLFLIRMWRRLLETGNRNSIPTLVLAGSPGWLSDDLMQQIHNSNFLDGHVIIVRAPTDEQLEQLYRHALFVMIPSFYEGWGLPVSESLARGKACLISNRGALPEAGQELVETFNPDNLEDGLAKAARMMFDTGALAKAEQVIRSYFKPVGWEVAAREISSF